MKNSFILKSDETWKTKTTASLHQIYRQNIRHQKFLPQRQISDVS